MEGSLAGAETMEGGLLEAETVEGSLPGAETMEGGLLEA